MIDDIFLAEMPSVASPAATIVVRPTVNIAGSGLCKFSRKNINSQVNQVFTCHYVLCTATH